ncbi:MAG: tetratricopeptide repeat protein [Pyrinomonadaceae bacterium]|nr:tetratricopeptide repeat protein [Phycisphaerales bacterium]
MNANEIYLRDALAMRRRTLENDNPALVGSISDMGQLLVRQGKLADAEPFQYEAVEVTRRLFGNDNANTLRRMGNLPPWRFDQNLD